MKILINSEAHTLNTANYLIKILLYETMTRQDNVQRNEELCHRFNSSRLRFFRIKLHTQANDVWGDGCINEDYL